MNSFIIEYVIHMKNGTIHKFKETGVEIMLNEFEFSFTRISDGFRIVYNWNNLNEHVKSISEIIIHN